MTSADATPNATPSTAQVPAESERTAGSSGTRRQRTWWETPDTRRTYSKYALRRLFGYDGYQRIKNRNWSTTSLGLLALGIVADISEIFGPITQIGLYTSIAAASILGIIILRRLRFCDLCVVPFVLSVIFAVIFGGVALAQNSDTSPGNGVIADFIPGVSEFQKLILGALFEIKTTADDTNKRVVELQSQIQDLSQQHNQRYEEILSKLETEKGISKSALSEHLVSLGARPEISVDEIPAFLEQFAKDYQILQSRLRALDMDDKELARIRGEASSLLEAGNLDGARQSLRDARAAIRQGRQSSAEREAALLADEAAIDNLDLRHRAAAAKYQEAADITSFDQTLSNAYQFSAAEALYFLGDRFGVTAALEESVQLFNEILEYYNSYLMMNNASLVHLNLGNALLKLGERTGDFSLLYESIRSYEYALLHYRLDSDPLNWAIAQNNLGGALLEIADRELGTESLTKAIRAFENALLVRTRETTPSEWAATKNNLGNAYRLLGLQSQDPELLKMAVSAYREAMLVWKPDTEPEYWATAQSNLGNSLSDLAGIENETERYEEALEVFDAALTVADRSIMPLMWAGIQHNKGRTLQYFGERTQSVERLQESITAFGEALKVRTREALPLEWANTKRGLARTHVSLGWQTRDQTQIEMGIGTYADGLSGITAKSDPFEWINFKIEQGNAFMVLGDLNGQSNAYLAAPLHFQEILESGAAIFDPLRPWMTSAQFHHRTCWAYIRASESSGNTQHLEQADPYCREAYRVMSQGTNDPNRVDTLYNLAYLNLAKAEMLGRRDLAQEALRLFQLLEADPLTWGENPIRPKVPQEIQRVLALLDGGIQ